MSFVRAYSKHEASYIFRIKDLDLVGVAKSFGLLRLPRMPELKAVDREGWQDADVDVSCSPFVSPQTRLTGCSQWDSFAYTDPAKEAGRLADLEKAKQVDKVAEAEKRRKVAAEQKKANAAWSSKTAKKEEKEKRKQKKDSKRRWMKEQQKQEQSAGDATDKKRGREGHEDDGDDGDNWEELAREERMAKKLKRGDISQRDFDNEFADL